MTFRSAFSACCATSTHIQRRSIKSDDGVERHDQNELLLVVNTTDVPKYREQLKPYVVHHYLDFPDKRITPKNVGICQDQIKSSRIGLPPYGNNVCTALSLYVLR